jgi:hypothetical protein
MGSEALCSGYRKKSDRDEEVYVIYIFVIRESVLKKVIEFPSILWFCGSDCMKMMEVQLHCRAVVARDDDHYYYALLTKDENPSTVSFSPTPPHEHLSRAHGVMIFFAPIVVRTTVAIYLFLASMNNIIKYCCVAIKIVWSKRRVGGNGYGFVRREISLL